MRFPVPFEAKIEDPGTEDRHIPLAVFEWGVLWEDSQSRGKIPGGPQGKLPLKMALAVGWNAQDGATK